MNTTTIPHAVQQSILAEYEQQAAMVAQYYQGKLQGLYEAHSRKYYIDFIDYGDDGVFFKMVSDYYAAIGECEPEYTNAEGREIIGLCYDRLTGEDKAATHEMMVREFPEGALDYYSDELIDIRQEWNHLIDKIESPGAEYSTQTFVVKAKHSPGVFHCLTCGAFSHSHDITGNLKARVGLWAMTDGSLGNYIVCECCKDKPTETNKALARCFAEREEFQRAEDERKQREFEEYLRDKGIDPDTGDLNGLSPGGIPQTKSEKLIDAMQSLGKDFRLNRLEDNVEVDGARLDDVTLSEINLRLVDEGFSRPNIADAINVVAGRNSYDPIEDYLNGLRWDGNNHMGKLMEYFTGDGTIVKYGSHEAPLHAALIGRWLTGAVARGLNRGASAFNHQTPMLVIIGPQGIGKSSWTRWLTSGIGYEFHRESMVNPHNIEDMRSMVTKWIWEVSELGSSLRRGDRDSLKAFITQEWHTYRKPWAKAQVTKPTLCNFVGTLNPETGFLDDPTGHRRFLPVAIKAIDHSYKDAIDADQLWAHVAHLYRTGQTTPELNRAELNALGEVYKEHEIENPLATYINMYFDVDPSNEAMKCHTAIIIQRLQEFGIKLPANAKVAGRELNDVLAPMGLKNDEFRVSGVKGRGWIGIQPNLKVPPTYKGTTYP